MLRHNTNSVFLLWLLASVFAIGCGGKKVPDQLTIQVPGSSPAILRLLSDSASWQQMIASQATEEDRTAMQRWQQGAKGIADVSVSWQHAGKQLPALLQVFPYRQDSSLIIWRTFVNIDSLLSGFSGIGHKRTLLADMQRLANLLTSYTEAPEHVYGFKPERGRVQDTVYLSCSRQWAAYPATADIYALVEKLEKYAQQQAVTVTRPPIMHVQYDAAEAPLPYRLMVALPVEKVVPAQRAISIKRMILGNLLTATITGKASELPALFEVFEEYRREHGFTSPAIPFMELVTDRRQQPDSTQWVTRFCYPIL